MWDTIRIIELPQNGKRSGVIEWIDINDVFPEYRLHIESDHLNRHVDISFKEIKNRSGQKATTFELVNYYDMSIEVLLQKRS